MERNLRVISAVVLERLGYLFASDRVARAGAARHKSQDEAAFRLAAPVPCGGLSALTP
jgi:hypothetical protein